MLARALREAVTNVVRLSGAARCTVRWTPSGLAVADDGVMGPECNGLRGPRERVARAGGTVTVRGGDRDEGTVRNHLASAIGKTHTTDRPESCRAAVENGWL